jgi:hypothetical protein
MLISQFYRTRERRAIAYVFKSAGVEVRGDLWDCLSFNSQPPAAPGRTGAPRLGWPGGGPGSSEPDRHSLGLGLWPPRRAIVPPLHLPSPQALRTELDQT